MLTLDAEAEGGTLGKRARGILIDVGQEGLQSEGDLLGVGALKADLDGAWSYVSDLPGEVEEAPEDAEGVLWLLVGLVEPANQELLGVAGSDLESVDHEAAILAEQGPILLGSVGGERRSFKQGLRVSRHPRR